MNFATRYSFRASVKFADQLTEFRACTRLNSFIPNQLNRTAARCFSQFKPKSNASSVTLLRVKRESLLPTTTFATIMVKRFMSVQEITRNLFLYTESHRKIEKDLKTLRLKQEAGGRPLVLILSWLQSKQKHLSKYAELYIHQGFDVLVAQINPWQLLWPVKGSQLVAQDIVNFLANNEYYRQMILHGFSVGGYVWGECLAHMQKDREKYQTVVDRIIGQVWDSVADITEIPIGVPKAMFPRNERLQAALQNYMIYHLKTFHEAATQHYIRSFPVFPHELYSRSGLVYSLEN